MEIAKVGGNVQIQKAAQKNAETVAATVLQSVKETPAPSPGSGQRVNVKA